MINNKTHDIINKYDVSENWFLSKLQNSKTDQSLLTLLVNKFIIKTCFIVADALIFKKKNPLENDNERQQVHIIITCIHI